MFITQKASAPPHGPEGARRHHRAAVPRRDGAGRHRAGPGPAGEARLVAMEMVHGAAGSTAFGAKKNLWAPAATGSAFDLSADGAGAARALARLPHHRQQHRRPQRRGVPAAGNRRRSLPLGGRVPDAVASEADAGLRPPGRHVARSVVRAEVRPGNADAVDAAVRRERRSGRRLLLRLLVRLHRLDQLGDAERAAADDSRSARGVRSAVRHRRHARGARRPPPPRPQHPRLGHAVGRTS